MQVGFDFSGGGSFPINEGIIIPQECESLLITVSYQT